MVWQPSPIEKRKVLEGAYTCFAEMPRVVREWAYSCGCLEFADGIHCPQLGSQVIEEAVRESLTLAQIR